MSIVDLLDLKPHCVSGSNPLASFCKRLRKDKDFSGDTEQGYSPVVVAVALSPLFFIECNNFNIPHPVEDLFVSATRC